MGCFLWMGLVRDAVHPAGHDLQFCHSTNDWFGATDLADSPEWRVPPFSFW